MSTKKMWRGLSDSGRSVLVMPQLRAAAVVSLIRRRTLRPAMAAASWMARRWTSVYQPGTARTRSETADLSSCDVISRSFAKYMATSWVAEKVRFSPRYET